MIKNNSPLVRTLLIAGTGIVLFALMDMLILSPYLEPAPRQALVFFFYTFFLLTLGLSFPVMRLMDSDDEPAKGNVALRGTVLHFAISVVLIIMYYLVYFSGTHAEVWIAMMAYITSFVTFIAYASSMK